VHFSTKHLPLLGCERSTTGAGFSGARLSGISTSIGVGVLTPLSCEGVGIVGVDTVGVASSGVASSGVASSGVASSGVASSGVTELNSGNKTGVVDSGVAVTVGVDMSTEGSAVAEESGVGAVILSADGAPSFPFSSLKHLEHRLLPKAPLCIWS